eukprot:692007_1
MHKSRAITQEHLVDARGATPADMHLGFQICGGRVAHIGIANGKIAEELSVGQRWVPFTGRIRRSGWNRRHRVLALIVRYLKLKSAITHHHALGLHSTST